jgi:DNA-3-methyladenine glycosylase II
MRAKLSVRMPYRLDLTVAALRRVPTNAVDVVAPDGRYLRALSNGRGINVIEVRQASISEIDVRITGRDGGRHLQTIARMLGTDVDLAPWYRRTKAFPWLDNLAHRFRGVKPPRYPGLWETLCHGIVFQQLSILAGAAIMRRLVECLSGPVEHEDLVLYPFPNPEAVLSASKLELQSIGLSRMKASYLKNAAEAVTARILSEKQIEHVSTDDAARELSKLRGIGPWSSAVILLRSFGRLGAFPLGDSGVARGIKALSDGRPIEIDKVLAELGDMRGMLYFHLLLARRPTAMNHPSGAER